MATVAGATVEDDDGGLGPLSELELLMFFNLLIAAGSETTRNAIALGMAALIDHPDQWDLLRHDPSVWPGAVEEILRWSSPTLYNRRTATRDVEVAGTKMKAGDKVTLWWASANRDEEVFDDPFTFDIRRTPIPIWPSATAAISAWGRIWPASRSASCSRSSKPASNDCRSTGPSSGSGPTSTPG